MEKEKRKFKLSRLLTVYLRRKNKSLHCGDPETLPAEGNTWTVKWPADRSESDEPPVGTEKRGSLLSAGGY